MSFLTTVCHRVQTVASRGGERIWRINLQSENSHTTGYLSVPFNFCRALVQKRAAPPLYISVITGSRLTEDFGDVYFHVVRDFLLCSMCEIPQTVALMSLTTHHTLVICLLLVVLIT